MDEKEMKTISLCMGCFSTGIFITMLLYLFSGISEIPWILKDFIIGLIGFTVCFAIFK